MKKRPPDEMIISEHAEDRIRKRCGIPKRAVSRNADIALRDGIAVVDCSGRLRKYFDFLFLSHGGVGANIRIYGDHVYIFTHTQLITVLKLPREHKNAALKVQAKKKAGMS